MTIVKPILLLVAVFAQLYASTAPTVPPPTEQLREQRGTEHIVPYFTGFVRTLVCLWALLEGAVLFALSGYCPPALARPLLHPSVPSTAPTPAFLAGTLLALAGALLRAHCFHALGPRFTFALSIRPSHTLVTHGAYSVVRHPSYTGGILLAVGWLLCVLDRRGSVVRVCAGWGSDPLLGPAGDDGVAMVTGVLVCVWAMAVVLMYVGMSQRMDREDAMLEKNFGEEWRAWAKRVPYRLVPGVY